MTMRWLCLCLVLIVNSLSVAASGRADLSAERARALAASPHPDARLLGAWLGQLACRRSAGSCAQEAEASFERVLAQPPQDARVLRVVISAIGNFLAPGSPRWQAERARLVSLVQTLDPDSLESWLPSLPNPADLDSRAEGAAVLARAARSTRSGVDYFENYRWIDARLAELPAGLDFAPETGDASPEMQRRQTAMALAATIAPGFVQFTRWCRQPDSAWARDCRTIARLLSRGETLLDRGIGKGVLQRLARTAEELAEAERLAADQDWRMAAVQHCGLLDEPSTLDQFGQPGVSEIMLIEAGLQARGLPLTAPADPDLRQRPCAAERDHAG